MQQRLMEAALSLDFMRGRMGRSRFITGIALSLEARGILQWLDAAPLLIGALALGSTFRG